MSVQGPTSSNVPRQPGQPVGATKTAAPVAGGASWAGLAEVAPSASPVADDGVVSENGGKKAGNEEGEGTSQRESLDAGVEEGAAAASAQPVDFSDGAEDTTDSPRLGGALAAQSDAYERPAENGDTVTAKRPAKSCPRKKRALSKRYKSAIADRRLTQEGAAVNPLRFTAQALRKLPRVVRSRSRSRYRRQATPA